ncbi:MAG: class I adenylate-forming enzyme family protein [Lachnospiraceae bacterium]
MSDVGIYHQTIGECLEARARMSAGQAALEYGNQQYTWKQVDEISDRLADMMYAMGLEKGDQAGIWSVNHPDYILTFLALCKLGAIPVLINACYKERELDEIIRYADMKALFYGSGYKDYSYGPVIDRLKEEPGHGIRSFMPLGEWNMYGGGRRKEAVVLPQDTACIMFTSGTTGKPKGVMLSHHNLIRNAAATADGMGWNRRDKQLLVVPLFHCFGVTSGLLASICAGCKIVMMEYFKTRPVLEAIPKFGITILNSVPSMFLAMIRNPEFGTFDLSSLRSGIIAGSPVTELDYQLLKEKLPGLDLHQSYGQTETSPCVTLMKADDPEDKKARTVGKVIPDVEVRIWDEEQGRVVKGGVMGEIQVRGYNVMKGYYQMAEETNAVISGDGWLKTGDMGIWDEDGYIVVAGRIKDMIIRAGENIMPGEIEQLILGFPGIRSVKVIGVPADVVQEEIAACLIIEDENRYSEIKLRLFLQSQLAHFKVPVYYPAFTEFPVTACGKIALADLKKEAIRKIRAEKRSES